MALAAARDLPQLSLADALELTVLVARTDPGRHQRVAARWLLRFLEGEAGHGPGHSARARLRPCSIVSVLYRLGKPGEDRAVAR